MFSCFHIATNAMVPDSDIIDIGMVDVRYLKMYNSHYADKGPVGKLTCRAQMSVLLTKTWEFV